MGGASIVAVATGALVFGSASTVEEQSVQDPTEVLPTVDVADSDTDMDTEKRVSLIGLNLRSTNNKIIDRSTTATVRDAEKSNKTQRNVCRCKSIHQ